MTRSHDDGPSDPPSWITGTVEDQFTPIYLAMARDTMRDTNGPVWRRGFSPAEVDAMDLTTVAALLGVGDPLARQRAAWERMRAPGPEVVMVPKVRPEARIAEGAILPG